MEGSSGRKVRIRESVEVSHQTLDPSDLCFFFLSFFLIVDWKCMHTQNEWSLFLAIVSEHGPQVVVIQSPFSVLYRCLEPCCCRLEDFVLCSLSILSLVSWTGRSDNCQSWSAEILSTIEDSLGLHRCFSMHSRSSQRCDPHPCRS